MRESAKRAKNKFHEDGVYSLVRSTGTQLSRIRPLIVKYAAPLLANVVTRSKLDKISSNTYNFGECESLTLPIDYRSNKPLFEFDRLPQQIHFEQPGVFELKDVNIVPNTGWVVSSDGLILESNLARLDLLQRELARNPTLFHQIRKYSKNQNHSNSKDLVCSLLDGDSFSKWVTKGLPRIKAIKYYEQATGKRPHILLPRNSPSYITESMELFGFEENQWSRWDGRRITVNNLVLPMHRSPEHLVSAYDQPIKYDLKYKAVAPSICQWVKSQGEEVVNKNKFDSPRRVIISRSDAKERRIINREVLGTRLDLYGFESVTLTNLSLKMQIDIFSNADIIIAPHGAGLSNIIFSKDCDVIEIFGKKIKPTYYLLAKSLGLNYYAFRGLKDDEDIRVNVSEVEELVDNIIN